MQPNFDTTHKSYFLLFGLGASSHKNPTIGKVMSKTTSETDFKLT